MPTGARRFAHEAGIAARLAWRALVRRVRDPQPAPADDAGFRSSLEPWVAAMPPGLLAAHAFHTLRASRPPWLDTGIDLDAGDTVTLLAAGRVFVSRLLDIWVPPAFQLWCRVGDAGPVLRGTRDTHTFVAERAGRLWLGGYFPGEWADPTGRLATPESDYSRASGGLSVLVLRWRPGTDAASVMGRATSDSNCPALVAAECRRLRDPPQPPPADWDYLWFLGPAEIYRLSATATGQASICCHTHGDSGILRRDARLPLEPGARLRWRWRVDQLPMDLAEDTLPSHDYMSIAVEFDDGQDITYYWSSTLPVGTAYRCPLPTWAGRETHVVVRSGRADLGRWLAEERDVYADYARLIGGPARYIARVWLIANSLLARGRGRCEYSAIQVESGARRIEVL